MGKVGILLALDIFLNLNDKHGHFAGDQVFFLRVNSCLNRLKRMIMPVEMEGRDCSDFAYKDYKLVVKFVRRIEQDYIEL